MNIQVVSITENSDGSADLILEVDKTTKELIKKKLGMNRWSNKKFQQFVIDTINNSFDKENFIDTTCEYQYLPDEDGTVYSCGSDDDLKLIDNFVLCSKHQKV